MITIYTKTNIETFEFVPIKLKPNIIALNDADTLKFRHIHWVQSKRHRLWFSTKSCICFSTKTHVNSVILILILNLTSLRNIKMCVVLNEVKFNLRMWIMLFIWVFVELQLHVFVENHSLWRFDCTQWHKYHTVVIIKRTGKHILIIISKQESH